MEDYEDTTIEKMMSIGEGNHQNFWDSFETNLNDIEDFSEFEDHELVPDQNLYLEVEDENKEDEDGSGEGNFNNQFGSSNENFSTNNSSTGIQVNQVNQVNRNVQVNSNQNGQRGSGRFRSFSHGPFSNNQINRDEVRVSSQNTRGSGRFRSFSHGPYSSGGMNMQPNFQNNGMYYNQVKQGNNWGYQQNNWYNQYQNQNQTNYGQQVRNHPYPHDFGVNNNSNNMNNQQYVPYRVYHYEPSGHQNSQKKVKMVDEEENNGELLKTKPEGRRKRKYSRKNPTVKDVIVDRTEMDIRLGKVRKYKGMLPEQSVSFLREWFLEHLQSPYPNTSDKEALMKTSGLNENQVLNWFTNKRKRVWKPYLDEIRAKEKGNSGNGGGGRRRKITSARKRRNF